MSFSLDRRFDPRRWQWDDGKGNVMKVADMTEDDLKQAVCQCLDAIEAVEYKLNGLDSVLWKFRKNKPIDEESK